MKFLSGFSRSCLSTCFYWSELNVLLDCGPFASLYGIDAEEIFISHSHIDHINGLLNLLYLKLCRNKFNPVKIYSNETTCNFITELLSVNRKHFLNTPFPPIELIPISNRKISLRDNICCYPVNTFHRCESNGFMFTRGKDIILLYTSDTNSNILANEDLYKAKYLLIESTYLEEENIEKAHSRGHISLAELNKLTEKFKGDKIYVTHFSEGYKVYDIHRAISKMRFNFLLEPIGMMLHNG